MYSRLKPSSLICQHIIDKEKVLKHWQHGTNLFSWLLMLQQNKLECLYWLFWIKLEFVSNNMTSIGWKGLPGTNTLTYFATMSRKKKMMYLITLTTLLFLILRIRILLGSGRSRIGSGGSSPDPYTPIRWACLKTWVQCYKSFYIRNLQIFVIS